MEKCQEEILVYDSQQKSKYIFGNDRFDEQHRVFSADQRYKKVKDMDHNKFYSALKPFYELQNEYDDTLVFESRFEGGNLH